MKKETFVSEVKEAMDVAFFKHKAMELVAKDKKKNKSALIILILAALIGSLGMKFFGGYFTPSFGMVIGMTVQRVIMSIVGIYVMSVVATSIFKGQAKHDAFFRVMAFGMVVTWLTILPALGFIAGIWGLILVVSILKTVHKLTTGGAIGAIIVSAIGIALAGMILAPVMSAIGVGGYGFDSARMNGRGSFGDFYKNGFHMDITTDDGRGSVKMEDGKMIIEGEDGEKMEISIPGQ